MSMTYEELELNGCYAMLCEALRAWHRIQHDHTREIAAKTLKDVYGYEFHLNGGGCSWRHPETDHEWAVNGMRALGLPADKFEENALVLARLLDGQAKDYEIASGRTVETMRSVYGSDSERFGVVEQFHNAFRRIATDWDRTLNRSVMDKNLERLLPLAAHAVRDHRMGRRAGSPPLLQRFRTHRLHQTSGTAGQTRIQREVTSHGRPTNVRDAIPRRRSVPYDDAPTARHGRHPSRSPVHG